MKWEKELNKHTEIRKERTPKGLCLFLRSTGVNPGLVSRSMHGVVFRYMAPGLTLLSYHRQPAVGRCARLWESGMRDKQTVSQTSTWDQG